GIARCEVEPELDWSGALRCVHLKSSRNPAANRNRAARALRCIVRSPLSSVYCERLTPLWVRSGPHKTFNLCPLYPQSGHVQRKKSCPLWANSGHMHRKSRCPLYPLKADIVDRIEKSASCHEQTFTVWASDKTGGRTFSPQHFCRGKIDDLLELSILGRESGRTLRPWLITACKKIQLLFAFPRLILIFCWATPCGVSACSSNTLRRRSDCATGPFDRPSWYLAALARVPAISWHGG